MKDCLKDALNNLNIDIDDKGYDSFRLYAETLIEWNKKFNLTSITDIKDICIKHFVDSLMIYKDIVNKKSLIDVGTGAGFPSLPLVIAGYKGLTVPLESNGKKVTFLNHVISELNLVNVKTCHNRAEQAARDVKYREKFAIAVARAVAPLNVLIEYCSPFLEKDGIFIAMKTDDSELVISKNAIKQLKLDIFKVDTCLLPGSDMKRCNIHFIKTDYTPENFPRADGTPKKRPL